MFEYQIDISNKLSDEKLSSYLQDISYEEFSGIFSDYSKDYIGKDNFLEIIGLLSSVKSHLQSDIEEAQDELRELLIYITKQWTFHNDKSVNAKLEKFFLGLINIWRCKDMSPESGEMFSYFHQQNIQIDDTTVRRFQFLEFFLVSLNYNKYLKSIPEKYSNINFPIIGDFRLLIEQRNLVKLQLHKDIVTAILRYYFEIRALPIVIEQLGDSPNSGKELSDVHGNTKTVFDDETIKREAMQLLGRGKYIHMSGPYKGKANFNGLADNLLKTTFKDVDEDLSLRQMTRRLKELLPDRFK